MVNSISYVNTVANKVMNKNRQEEERLRKLKIKQNIINYALDGLEEK